MTPAPLSSPTARATPRAFAHIDTWVFDLDNTLYPHHLNLWQQVDERIRNYIAKFLDTTYDNAFRKQKDFYRRYGTTMRGMMVEHGMNPDDFLDFVHQIDPISSTRSIIRRSSRTRRSAPRWNGCRAASSFSPTAPALTPTPS